MAHLPARALSLVPRFVVRRLAGAALPAGVLAALGALALALTLEDVARLRSQDAIATHGARALHPRVDIERDLSFFLLRARRYEVSFDDASGRAHAVRVREHDLSVAPLVVEGPPEVHYDPADPSRVSVGFARQNVGAQWAAISLLGGVSALSFVLAGLLFARMTRTLRAARAAARVGRIERAARVVLAQRSLDSAGRPTGEEHLLLELEGAAVEHLDSYRAHGARTEAGRSRGRAVRLEVVTDPTDPPCFLDAAAERALVVIGAGQAPVLVLRSGHPFVLEEAERRALGARKVSAGTRDRSPNARGIASGLDFEHS